MTMSPEHEVAVVGSLILDPANVETTRRIVSAADFLDPHLGECFALLIALHDDGLPIGDHTLLVDRLRQASLLEPLGGVAGIGRIVVGCGNAANAEHYAREVRSASSRRGLQRLADTLRNRALDPTADPHSVIEWAESQLKRYDGESRDRPLARMRSADELFSDYIDRLTAGDVPQLLQLGTALDGLEVGEGLITIVGAPPGSGKTALASQVMFEALDLHSEQIVYLLNAEMGFDAIARRELTRLTGIASEKIRFGRLDEKEREQIVEAKTAILPALRRMQHIEEPNHESLLELLDKPPGLVVVDYLQKFSPADKEVRIGVNLVMGTLRRLAKAGHAVLALSSTKRDQKGGHASAELSMASFKESGECEFQADSAYVLRDNGPLDFEWVRDVTLGCVKNRHGRKVDFDLAFNMPQMRFSAKEPVGFAEFAEYATTDDLDCFGGGE